MRIFAGVALLSLGIASALPGPWVPCARAADIDEKIATAKTAADHEAIAAYYDEQAKAAEAKAAEHRKMEQEYRKAGGPAAKAQLPAHCEGLVKSYIGAAKEYAALAKAHREMAKHAK
ncbi:MAG TPA: hypothetical protein VKA21_02730 [Candidatus Binatia bacterium]|nr:hypothetical protein [Candidatus Binatia bacterium]